MKVISSDSAIITKIVAVQEKLKNSGINFDRSELLRNALKTFEESDMEKYPVKRERKRVFLFVDNDVHITLKNIQNDLRKYHALWKIAYVACCKYESQLP